MFFFGLVNYFISIALESRPLDCVVKDFVVKPTTYYGPISTKCSTNGVRMRANLVRL